MSTQLNVNVNVGQQDNRQKDKLADNNKVLTDISQIDSDRYNSFVNSPRVISGSSNSGLYAMSVETDNVDTELLPVKLTEVTLDSKLETVVFMKDCNVKSLNEVIGNVNVSKQDDDNRVSVAFSQVPVAEESTIPNVSNTNKSISRVDVDSSPVLSRRVTNVVCTIAALITGILFGVYLAKYFIFEKY